MAGMRVGALLELFALDVLPVGASRYPEYGPAAVGAAVLAAGLPQAGGTGVGAVLGLLVALPAGWTLEWLRHANARHVHRLSAALSAGSTSAIRRLQWAGLRRDALRSALVTSAALAAAAGPARSSRSDGRAARAADPGARGQRRRRRAVRGDSHRRRRATADLGRDRPRRRDARGAGDGGGRVKGASRALLRLMAVQGAWSYERMIGVGMGYAAEPLLKDLGAVEPARLPEATARSAEFFNCHPYLAGLALGRVGPRRVRRHAGRTDPPAADGALQPARRPRRPVLLGRAGAHPDDDGPCRDRAGGRGRGAGGAGGELQRRPIPRHAMGAPDGPRERHAGGNRHLGLLAPESRGPRGGAGRVPRPGSPSRWCVAGSSSRSADGGSPWRFLGAAAALALLRWGGTRWTSLRVGLLTAALSLLLTRIVP